MKDRANVALEFLVICVTFTLPFQKCLNKFHNKTVFHQLMLLILLQTEVMFNLWSIVSCENSSTAQYSCVRLITYLKLMLIWNLPTKFPRKRLLTCVIFLLKCWIISSQYILNPAWSTQLTTLHPCTTKYVFSVTPVPPVSCISSLSYFSMVNISWNRNSHCKWTKFKIMLSTGYYR